MRIESIGDASGINYDKTGPIIFTKGCNYRCGFCYNNSDGLLSPEKVESFLRGLETKTREGWYNGVTVCGGEPTIQSDLPYFLERLKKMGLAVKLDTNGKNFPMLGRLIKEGLVDYIAMDVKGPFRLYPAITGMEHIDFRDGFLKGLGAVGGFPNHEFRTTVCPIVREDGKITFMTPEEIGETAEEIFNNLANNNHRYFLQGFLPVKNRLLDKRLEEFPETPKETLEKGVEIARQYLPNAQKR